MTVLYGINEPRQDSTLKDIGEKKITNMDISAFANELLIFICCSQGGINSLAVLKYCLIGQICDLPAENFAKSTKNI